MADLWASLTALAIPWTKIGWILVAYGLAFVLVRLSTTLARRILRLNRFTGRKNRLSQQRQETLQGLLAGIISVIVILIATVASLSLFIDADTIVWMIGLFSAAFGLGARPLVSDLLAGLSFIFEDTFDVGEKVQLQGLPGGEVEGVVERVNLRTTLIQAVSGEPFIVPNGEIRIVRNFSRGRHSMANVHIRLAAHDLPAAIDLLENLREEALSLLPNLLEPWQVISETGELGQQTTLTVIAKARFGKAAEMRPRLLTLVQERLTDAGLQLPN
ncbi:MAG: mechanosensitive ion channel family protein [Anaerolineales bacterium]|nr:mechanosensitive ion channel family protein [Anaerolineales bacterium]MCB0018327.1 mechanosensitive ion channel family protein [Anaerolineales bacterium]